MISISIALVAASDGPKRAWDFESDEVGKIAAGFSNEAGRWVVEQVGPNRVLGQKAESDDETFNVALVGGTTARDLDLSVRLRAVAGKDDRGGGLVWRARDARNYYIARYNPLEDNFRVYKVEGGKRTMFADAKVAGDAGWHTLRVTMTGSKIACYLDGKKHLEVEDATFPGGGPGRALVEGGRPLAVRRPDADRVGAMSGRATDVRVVAAEVFFLPVATRVPLKFGAEVTTHVTCARARLTVVDAKGRAAEGWGETP